MLEDLRDYGLIKQRTVSTLSGSKFSVQYLFLSRRYPRCAEGNLTEVQPDTTGNDADVFISPASHVCRFGGRIARSGVHRPRDQLPSVCVHR